MPGTQPLGFWPGTIIFIESRASHAGNLLYLPRTVADAFRHHAYLVQQGQKEIRKRCALGTTNVVPRIDSSASAARDKHGQVARVVQVAVARVLSCLGRAALLKEVLSPAAHLAVLRERDVRLADRVGVIEIVGLLAEQEQILVIGCRPRLH